MSYQQLLNSRYRVGRLIGHGGMGDVYLGTDTRLGRTVAIKLLRPELSENPEFKRRFRIEAMAAARMANTNIVRTFDANQDLVVLPDGTQHRVPYLVMEYVEGQTVKEILAERPMAADEALTVAAAVLTALEYAHRSGIVHRDIKPGNIMVSNTGTVKVMDFGIARILSESSTNASSDNASKVVGTAQYFAPEQAQGKPVDARTDIYSTGVLLFEMLTHRLPFTGDNPAAIAYQHVNMPTPKPSSFNPDLDDHIDRLLLTALQKNPEHRYQTAPEFRTDVERVRRGEAPFGHPYEEVSTQLMDTPAGAAEAANSPLAEFDEGPATTSTPILESEVKRSKLLWTWGIVGGVVVLAAAALIWLLFLQPSVSSPKNTSVTVQDVTDMTYPNGRAELVKQGLKVHRVDKTSSTVASGNIITTKPQPGQVVKKGTTVTVQVSSGREQVTVPDLTNLTQDEATAKLTALGLNVGTVTQVDNSAVPPSTVLASNPVAKSKVTIGSSVNLSVSRSVVTVPNVVGQPLAQATAAINSLGLQAVPMPVATCQGTTAQTITRQSVTGQAPTGTQVQLYYNATDTTKCVTPTPTPTPSSSAPSQSTPATTP